MRLLAFVFFFSSGLLCASPKVESEKLLESKKDEAGELITKTEKLKYVGGWIQVIISNFKKGSESTTVLTYNSKGQIAAVECRFPKGNPPLGVQEGTNILSASFEQLTGKKYDAAEFHFTETEDRRTAMIWRNKYEGQGVYAYLGAFSLGCVTSSAVAAAENGLIPR